MMKYLLVFAIITTRISVLLVIGSEDNRVPGDKKLTKEGAAALCKMKHLADKVAEKGAEDLKKKTKNFAGFIEFEQEKVDNWLEKLRNRKQYSDGYAKLSDSDVEKVKEIFDKAKDGITKQIPEAEKEAREAERLYDEVKKAAQDARGQDLDDDTAKSTGLYRVLNWYCITKDNNKDITHNCDDGIKFRDHYLSVKRSAIDCSSTGYKEDYDWSANALQSALNDWENVKPKEVKPESGGNDVCKATASSESHPCTMTEEWQTHYKDSILKLKELEDAHKRGKAAHDAMLGYANTAYAVNTKVEQEKPLAEVIAAAKDAGKKGAKIIIPAAAPATSTDSTKSEDSAPAEHVDRGIATNETQVEVGIDADFDSLLEAAEAAEVKSRHQRTAMIILAVLVPAIILAAAVAFFIMVKRRRNNSQDVDTGKAEGGVSSGKVVM
ncbi:65 kDa invariant surface glycoprotein, putative [Trypanosoma brucei gambiense DAL972]|uniref:65 kDa invariant surface glycoprotein, putative n=1 Tax=Trypanosoma brucei gambiense (strain MHOM/CI/86/DAL972) TaxID=679716 RepID=C9ZJ84_TRYB9|nr:65 kDa invariant surface glycoprotein, putative [Trypanosoma brucei gambiense DAL972]CBH09443.1 65 kDa invariant surface glycoprotein, putative [Trypanosoma brucei gambiense DAL972]|eukprot:XP_011771748.1 65 kDa invariant surface glycoprotein, putative [Trypanosoma brucei gambiense DAL972]